MFFWTSRFHTKLLAADILHPLSGHWATDIFPAFGHQSFAIVASSTRLKRFPLLCAQDTKSRSRCMTLKCKTSNSFYLRYRSAVGLIWALSETERGVRVSGLQDFLREANLFFTQSKKCNFKFRLLLKAPHTAGVTVFLFVHKWILFYYAFIEKAKVLFKLQLLFLTTFNSGKLSAITWCKRPCSITLTYISFFSKVSYFSK